MNEKKDMIRRVKLSDSFELLLYNMNVSDI